ncbi:MAG: O-antigen ligase family protein [Planctomycetia bacterium]|nr:O-antigen ligase family protein [Planctomycetia bacterium]
MVAWDTGALMAVDSDRTRSLALASSAVGVSILVGSLGREMTWLQTPPGLFSFPCYVMAAVGVLVATVACGAISFSSAHWKRVMLVAWFFFAIGLEWVLPSDNDMPFDRASQLVLFGYGLGALCGLVGLQVGTDPQVTQRLLGRAAFFFACLSVLMFVLGDPPAKGVRGGLLVFPAPYIGFPMQLFFLFPFCWYLDRWLAAPRLLSGKLLGILASSLSVIVMFHKPFVFASAVGIISVILLRWYCGHAISGTLRFIALAGICAVGFAWVDSSTQGELSGRYLDEFYAKFLHTTAGNARGMEDSEVLESASGGRFALWAAAWERYLEDPIVGTGLGQRARLSAAGDNDIPLHNQYLDFLLSLGIVGTLPIIIGLVAWMRAAKRKLRGSDSGWAAPLTGYVITVASYNLGGTSNIFMFQFASLLFCMGLVAAPRMRVHSSLALVDSAA